MNQPLLLHVVERLEGFVAKLPASIQKPILSELTPLKELFLQQRPPRFLVCGSKQLSVPEIISTLFPGVFVENFESDLEGLRWQDLQLAEHSTVAILDAREAGDSANRELKEELYRQPADIILFVDDSDGKPKSRKNDFENLRVCLEVNDKARPDTKVIGLGSTSAKENDGATEFHDRFAAVFSLADQRLTKQSLSALVTQLLPNEARIEMLRISKDRGAQIEIAQMLVKSTTAICTAIGAQPIPLADLPILTTLQLVMVSGIMYISGRERSLRAATEFVGALGANVGAGMLLREGTRVILKFFPGWGNVICGMVAGAGTYAIGRAAIVFFLEGVSLKDARRIYQASRKKSRRPALLGGKSEKRKRLPGK